jgi:nicotinamide mononucleotide adenylyltransferase
MRSVIDYNKPTAMMLGRWQPWHQGHQELFKKH